MKSKKICYITGCLGFIGSYVTRLFLSEGWYVRGIDKCTYAANIDLLKEFNGYQNFYFENKDINDIKFLYDCDYFINTAAETHVGNSISKSEDFVHSNINGVYNILELLRNYRQENSNKPTLIHFSTDEVYGDIEDGDHHEHDFLKPSNPYSATKAAADMLILAWSRTYGLPYIIIRPTNNYGIGQYVEKLIPKTCKYLFLGRKIPLHNSGSPIRNWLHAEDTANAVLEIINSQSNNEIYNISGGFEQTNIDTVKKIISIIHKDKNFDQYIDFSIHRPGQDSRYSLNDSKLKNLGWTPKKNFDTEIINIVNFYKNKFIW
jgi:dTDP-glucose 4,6-dehydratase